MLTEWQIEHLRFSVFLLHPIEPEPVASWPEVTGENADDTHIKGTGDQRVVRQQGPFGGATMRAEVRSNRIDWHLLPLPLESATRRPIAGPYAALKDRFCDIMLTWLDRATPAANRMAYGALLSLGGGDRSDALTVLRELLETVQVDARNTWDFDYTVNRRRESKVISGLMINRLCRWHLAQEVQGAIELPADGGQPKFNASTVHLPMLMLDINTMPEFPDSLDCPADLLQELASLGTEIALNGDVP